MSNLYCFEMFTVYENPRDYPGKFVVRRWLDFIPDTKPMIVCDSLDLARAVIPQSAVCLGRYAEDDPAIREVWL